MATTPAVRKARRSLTWLLVLILGLVGLIGYGFMQGEATLHPKLALDLEGGTQILLAPKQTDGNQVSGEQLDQAVSIIRQRVNASGVSEAEVTTQGNQNISVSIPGKADEATLARIQASSKLEFRPVLTYTGSATSAQVDGGDGSTAEEPVDGEAAPTPEATSESDPSIDPSPLPKGAGDVAWLTEGLQQKFMDFTCDSEAAQSAGDAPADRPLITCDPSGQIKYVLGPVELGGEVITDAVAQPETTSTGATTGGWVVQITMNKAGTKAFGEVSTRLYGAQAPMNQFAFVLDGKVLSAPTMQAQILDGRPSISGGFTQDSAKALADQLKFGALPVSFVVQSQEDISATLGTNQLQAGLLAGLIGLLLVVVYSLIQYRVLGLLTVASLVVAAVLTYLLLTLMSWREGYRLSLAGVAGVIVAIGITADSFIVYFERIRDELRDGRGLESAVEAGWKRAIRTVLASDGINFLAAAILFLLAIGNVRGFAFTLGLTTIVDVLVVVLFTHPLMTLLSRTRFYKNGHRFSGLDPRQLGAVYRGRAQFREPVVAASGPGKKVAASQKEAQRRQTIAERKAAEAAGLTDAAVAAGKDS
ncbi:MULTISPECIES: protein translocase subunit SecD [unclassified Leucobacter]|uniref:protein translocase subunit SecD n=1 Tax=unclassified Leucobacter TaxID=2621730 RepID=UPI00165DD2DD|nr:protein translocase subunit SecD [Leucobacter sp. cx-87]